MITESMTLREFAALLNKESIYIESVVPPKGHVGGRDVWSVTLVQVDVVDIYVEGKTLVEALNNGLAMIRSADALVRRRPARRRSRR